MQISMQKYFKSHGPKNHKWRSHAACVRGVRLHHRTPFPFPLKWMSRSQVRMRKRGPRESRGTARRGVHPVFSLRAERVSFSGCRLDPPVCERFLGRTAITPRQARPPHFPAWDPFLLPLDTHPALPCSEPLASLAAGLVRATCCPAVPGPAGSVTTKRQPQGSARPAARVCQGGAAPAPPPHRRRGRPRPASSTAATPPPPRGISLRDHSHPFRPDPAVWGRERALA